MNKRKWVSRRFSFTALVLVLLSVLLLTGAAWAGYSASHSINWNVLSGGGEPVESTSGEVELNGSLGQNAIGLSSSGHTNLGSGFWYSLGMEDQRIYLKTYLPITFSSH